MTTEAVAWPQKTRELDHYFFDSRIWNDFRYRPDDVVISTYPKAGTTWVMQIVCQLIFGGDAEREVDAAAPWLELRVPPWEAKRAMLEAQTHRRCVKTHLPLDALVFSSAAKYIHVGRDGRDVVWSMHNHQARRNDLLDEFLLNAPGRVHPPVGRPPESIRRYFLDWLEGDGHPFWSFWEHEATWWATRHLPNVLFLHFEDLRRDLPGSIRKVAEFLDMTVAPEMFERIVTLCGFEHMKSHAEKYAPLGGKLWEGGAATFIHKGTNGRWRNELTDDDCRRYETSAIERLGSECARWLASGGPID